MKIYASMTTIPDRIDKILPVINSVLNQTYKLDRVIINIPYKSLSGKYYKVPKWMKLLQSNNLEINRCIDYGPATKLIPSLNFVKSMDVYIITFDDDKIVDKNVVEIMVEKIKKYPLSALSFSGWNFGKFPFYFQRMVNTDKDVEVDWLQGCHSILYPAFLINKLELLTFIQNINFKKFSKHDDHLISAYLSHKNIKKIAIQGNAKKMFTETETERVNGISNSIMFNIEVISISKLLKDKGFYFNNTLLSKSVCILFLSVSVFILFLLVLLFKIIQKLKK